MAVNCLPDHLNQEEMALKELAKPEARSCKLKQEVVSQGNSYIQAWVIILDPMSNQKDSFLGRKQHLTYT